MPAELIVLTILHILVFVYWLGGDLGAFYASHLLTDENKNTDVRMAAAKMVSDIDLAPKTALILSAPTGLFLAQATGWLNLPAGVFFGIFTTTVIWIFALWKNHFISPKNALLAQIDMIIRYCSLAALLVAAITILTGYTNAPVFIGAKFLVLAGAMVTGFLVRRTLKNFSPAIANLAAGKASMQDNQTIQLALSKTRPLVMLIWVFILCAAILGVAKPI